MNSSREASSTGVADDQSTKGMVWIPGGTFLMGSNDFYPEEAPVHEMTTEGFWMDQHQVTNERFHEFVASTGYQTIAERVPTLEEYPDALPEMLVSGSVVFDQPAGQVDLRNHYNWWTWVSGANWQHPEGPNSNLEGRESHPVLHVAWDDVQAYANWAGKDLPTEAEWERAGRGGLENLSYAWGEQLAPEGRMLANYWQGAFPVQNLVLDGFERTAPVGSFPPNPYGLYDMIGNAWEWTSDWFTSVHRPTSPCCGGDQSRHSETDREQSVDPQAPGLPIPRKVLKGGSFACAANYCQRYRPAARSAHPIDTGTNHISFRCVVRKSSGA